MKATTVGDLIAAAKVGAIDLGTVASLIADPEDEGHPDGHVCRAPGCRHGEAVALDAARPVRAAQPDRQVKLACPACGAIARMTASALAKAGSIECWKDTTAFVPVPRRVYNKKVSA
jgi:hypothetical protein